MAATATELGFTFEAKPKPEPVDLPVELFQRGTNRSASNHMGGVRNDRFVHVFDYGHWDQSGTTVTNAHKLTCVVVQLERAAQGGSLLASPRAGVLRNVLTTGVNGITTFSGVAAAADAGGVPLAQEIGGLVVDAVSGQEVPPRRLAPPSPQVAETYDLIGTDDRLPRRVFSPGVTAQLLEAPEGINVQVMPTAVALWAGRVEPERVQPLVDLAVAVAEQLD
jgi:hypothetical protein